MMSFIFYIILLTIFVEAVTEILVASSIFSRPRGFIGRRSAFLGELIHCGHCTSVWVSAIVVWMILPPAWIFSIISNFWVAYIITIFVVHRLSNLFHEFNSKWLNRRPFALAVHKTETVLMPDLGNNYESTE